MYNEPKKEEKPKQPKINLDLLPSSMKERYAAMGILPKPELKKKKYDVDIQKMKQKKIEKELPIEKKLAQIEIKATEKSKLDFAFLLISQDKEWFDSRDVIEILQKLNVRFLTKSEVDRMVWEVDENLDSRVNKTEFLNMYKKCSLDKTGLEPKSLYHLVQFLMYLNPEKVKRNVYSITVEDTLELLYVRFGRQNLDSEIHAIFGDEEKTKDGQEKEVNFQEYLERVNERAIQQRKQRKEEQKQQFQYHKLEQHDKSKHY